MTPLDLVAVQESGGADLARFLVEHGAQHNHGRLCRTLYSLLGMCIPGTITYGVLYSIYYVLQVRAIMIMIM